MDMDVTRALSRVLSVLLLVLLSSSFMSAQDTNVTVVYGCDNKGASQALDQHKIVVYSKAASWHSTAAVQ